MLAESTDDPDVRDPWVTQMRELPATVVSNTLEAPLEWQDATLERGDAFDVVRRLEAENDGALRSQRTLDANIQELLYRPTLHSGSSAT